MLEEALNWLSSTTSRGFAFPTICSRNDSAFQCTFSVGNTLNRPDPFWLVLSVDEGNSLLFVQSIPTKQNSDLICILPVLQVHHDVSAKRTKKKELAFAKSQPTGTKLCRSQCKEGQSGVQFQLAFFVKVLAFRVWLINMWREIPPLSSESRTHTQHGSEYRALQSVF